MLFSSVAATFQTQMATAATITAFEGGDAAVHRNYLAEGGLTGTHALLRLESSGAQLVHVVTLPEPGVVEDAKADDVAAVRSLVADAAVAQRLQSFAGRNLALGFVLATDGRRAAVSVATSDGNTSADLFHFDVGAAGPYLVAGLGNVADFAIYLEDMAPAGQALIASTDELPLTGPVSQTTTEVAGEKVLIEVSGSVAPDLPPAIVALGGSVIAAMLAGAHLLALRRRDTALAAIAAMQASDAHRRQAEADLQQSQRLESVGQLAGGIAHDVNNLLAAIASNAELIAGDATDDRTRADVAEILDATRRGAELTRRLLTFSRRGPTASEPVWVDDVIRELLPLLSRTIGEDIDLDLDLDAADASVLGEVGEIEQVVMNLVVNARDASRASTQQWIGIRTRVVGPKLLLEVADRGEGMDPEIRAHALEPFFSTKPSDEGSGLGLAICYGIITRAGGRLHIDSTTGAGTVVRIELPVHDREAASDVDPPARAPEHPVTHATGEVVLLVEDEPSVRRAAARLLERSGYLVATAGDGTEALAALDLGLVPDVLVTDVVLPGPLNGRDVATWVRGRVPQVRIVYASGYADDVISPEHLEAEGAIFVAKPFAASALLAAVERAAVPR